MPKWYKYLIVVAIAIFVICVIADAMWSKEAKTMIEQGRNSIPKFACLFVAGLMYAICISFILLDRSINNIPGMKQYTQKCPYNKGAIVAVIVIVIMATGLLFLGLLG